MTQSRIFADRRGGLDRRAVPRRRVVASALREQRCVVDRRRGAERRSTLDRRVRPRRPSVETPSEHLRNALQLLWDLKAGDPSSNPVDLLAAAVKRLNRALELLEPSSLSRRSPAQPPAPSP